MITIKMKFKFSDVFVNVNVTFIDRFARFENSATMSESDAEAVFNG